MILDGNIVIYIFNPDSKNFQMWDFVKKTVLKLNVMWGTNFPVFNAIYVLLIAKCHLNHLGLGLFYPRVG